MEGSLVRLFLALGAGTAPVRLAARERAEPSRLGVRRTWIGPIAMTRGTMTSLQWSLISGLSSTRKTRATRGHGKETRPRAGFGLRPGRSGPAPRGNDDGHAPSSDWVGAQNGGCPPGHPGGRALSGTLVTRPRRPPRE